MMTVKTNLIRSQPVSASSACRFYFKRLSWTSKVGAGSLWNLALGTPGTVVYHVTVDSECGEQQELL